MYVSCYIIPPFLCMSILSPPLSGHYYLCLFLSTHPTCSQPMWWWSLSSRCQPLLLSILCATITWPCPWCWPFCAFLPAPGGLSSVPSQPLSLPPWLVHTHTLTNGSSSVFKWCNCFPQQEVGIHFRNYFTWDFPEAAGYVLSKAQS